MTGYGFAGSAMGWLTTRPTRAPQPPQAPASPGLAAGDQPTAPEPAQALSATELHQGRHTPVYSSHSISGWPAVEAYVLDDLADASQRVSPWQAAEEVFGSDRNEVGPMWTDRDGTDRNEEP